jgi:hypothetical protein
MPEPMAAYRRIQRELRREFDAFTRANCAACPTPCCRRPARILPTDIALAQSAGWRRHLTPIELREPPEAEGQPCLFLGEQGCTFPNDLRPFGCTAYLCRFMYEKLDRNALKRLKRLTRELESVHTTLLRTLRPVAWREEL